MKNLSRREVLSAMIAVPALRVETQVQEPPPSYEDFLGQMAWSREAIDEFLDPAEPNWAVFDPEIGYRHGDTVKKDGIDGSYCIYRTEPTGERKKVNFAGRPCRFNTYGDSFTHCDQVSDGETWQEYLASHFGEPIRNFGTGGYGVYQAYRRMLREESTSSSVPFVLFNIWIDDHRRSLMAVRWFHIGFFRDLISSREATHYFHANPWCHVRFDLDTGELREFENTHRTPESLYQMCEPEYVIETFHDDLYVQIEYAMTGRIPPGMERIRRLAELVGMEGNWNSPGSIARSAEQLFWRSGMKASETIVDWACDFAEKREKNLLFVLSYRGGDVVDACRGEIRLDRPFVDFLRGREIRHVDSLEKHVQDFGRFSTTPEEYVTRYYHGHYAPQGNHFFAYALKDDLVDWLRPVPLTYSQEDPSIAEISAILAR